MSDRKFLDHNKLRIHKWEWDGLIKFLENAPKLHHQLEAELYPEEGLFFNLGTMARKFKIDHGAVFSCCTAACIGGHVALYNGMSVVEAYNYVTTNQYKRLHNLYYPPDVVFDTVSPKEAAAVVLNFLLTGVIDWYEVRHRQREH